eukprot:gnl/TRDRNA2_/TRDRNA2_159479_c0_seq2.p1 gnl/TRDRNA2_/TRDRNA2_159479_c0~~gnl/TRDRNA2_/TRDRNA2_159479_c0_seq2.p1  ORF type:complete len:460 (+),score=54.69 gnl/TRDRNA2_/TRDRNA2_159479_c0_seq2:52-1431(+)
MAQSQASSSSARADPEDSGPLLAEKQATTPSCWCDQATVSTPAWPRMKGLDPIPDLDSAWASQFPLSTSGRYIVNVQGKRFKFAGANWYGASDCYHVVGGLDVQRLEVICASIRAMGFTMVRLPHSNEMLRSPVLDGGINYDINPNLKGMSALEVLDETIRCLGRHRIAVMLNNHTTYGRWCAGPDRNGLWFDAGSEYTEERFIQDWIMLAERYRNFPHVIGCDLRNEVRFQPPAKLLERPKWPAWQNGSISRACGGCDWCQTSANTAERVLATNPALLIVIERIVWPQTSIRDYVVEGGPLLPRFKGKLVLGLHSYSWSGPGRFIPRWSIPDQWAWAAEIGRRLGLITRRLYGEMDPAELAAVTASEWIFALEESRCPVWISEFGANLSDPTEMAWLEEFTKVMGKADVDWAYWPLNVGPKPGGEGDEAYGMLKPDWTVKDGGDRRIELLQAIGMTPP